MNNPGTKEWVEMSISMAFGNLKKIKLFMLQIDNNSFIDEHCTLGILSFSYHSLTTNFITAAGLVV